MKARQGTYWEAKLNGLGFHDACRCQQSPSEYSVWCDTGDGGRHYHETEDVQQLLDRAGQGRQSSGRQKKPIPSSAAEAEDQ